MNTLSLKMRDIINLRDDMKHYLPVDEYDIDTVCNLLERINKETEKVARKTANEELIGDEDD
jgi:hypothetical protein